MTLGAGERLLAVSMIAGLLESARLSSEWDGIRRELVRRVGERVAAATVSGSPGA